MKTGTQLNSLAERITTEAKSKRDYVADTRKLSFTNAGEVLVETMQGPRAFTPTRHCVQQIAGRCGIPAKYVERMQQGHPELLAQNINHWFAKQPERRMLRTLDNGTRVARAFLSERYRPLDNYDLANAVLPKLAAAGCRVESAELTEHRLYIQAVTPKLEDIIAARRAEGTGHRIGEANDVVQAGLVISNSEVGCGAVKIEPMIFRLVCRNGLILPTALRKYHVGRAGNGDEGEDGNPLFTENTLRLTDKAFWAQVCDVVDGALDEIKFRKAVSDISAKADGKSVGNPLDVVEVLTNRIGLNEAEQKNVLEHLTTGGSLDLWGVCNAVTRAAEDSESYDRAVDLERAGALVLEMKPSDFAKN